jgi:RNA polymerase-binding transcription factor DksA
METISYSDTELNEFRFLILTRLGKAYEELNGLKTSLEEASVSNIKQSEEEGDNTQDISICLLMQHQSQLVSELERALARIDKGTYGVCFLTGTLIPKERLLMIPQAIHAISSRGMC